MKTFFAFSASLLAGVSLMSAIASADAIKPGCIGGCLPTAIAAPTPVFPVGYQCKTNWPLAGVAMSCKVIADNDVFGSANNPRPTTKHHKPN